MASTVSNPSCSPRQTRTMSRGIFLKLAICSLENASICRSLPVSEVRFGTWAARSAGGGWLLPSESIPARTARLYRTRGHWRNSASVAEEECKKRASHSAHQEIPQKRKHGKWKHWKKPRTKVRNLCKLGVSFETAYKAGICRRGYWWTSNTVV